jgi:hypothetical protein
VADQKISALTAATAAAAANELAINEAGTSKKLSVDLMQQYLFTSWKYAPGSFTIVTGKFALMTQSLILTSTQRGTLQGTARLRIN